jgi:hypothetical protein
MRKIFIVMVGVMFSMCTTNLFAQQADESLTADNSVNIAETPPMSYLGDESYNVRIYPNPAIDFVNIQSSDLMEKSYIIADMAGKQIAVGQVMNGNVMTHDLSAYPSGMYYARFEDGTVLRFIVKR